MVGLLMSIEITFVGTLVNTLHWYICTALVYMHCTGIYDTFMFRFLVFPKITGLECLILALVTGVCLDSWCFLRRPDRDA